MKPMLPRGAVVFGDPRWIEWRGQDWGELHPLYEVTCHTARRAGLCSEGIRMFCDEALSGRTIAEVRELVPLIDEYPQLTRVLDRAASEYRRQNGCWFCGYPLHASWCVERKD